MLRAALPLGRGPAVKPVARWKAPAYQRISRSSRENFSRGLADIRKPHGNTKASISDSTAAVLPGSQSRTATTPTPPPPGPVGSVSPSQRSASASSNSIIPPSSVPLTPPSPPGGKVQIAPPTTIPPSGATSTSISPPTPPPPPPKRRWHLRRFLLYIVLLTGLGYGGGVWYSLISDNFHDFFTEYIPFGEDAVLYFEEREFRKRFPRATNPTNRPSTLRDTGEKVTIPSKSGLSWRVAEDEGSGSDLGKKGRHMSALDANPAKAEVQQAQRAPNEATAGEKTKAVEIAKKEAPPPAAIVSSTVKKDTVEATPKESIPVTPAAVAETKPLPMAETAQKERASEASQTSTSTNTGSSSSRGPEAAKVGVFTPITRIDPLKIDHANEPIVQDLVHTLNGIITVINADNSNGKFNSTMSKAKAELATVGKKIMDLKAGEQAAAEQKIKSLHQDFDKAAKELVQRLENEMQDQEARWKEEFESEREKISQMYQERMTSEVERANELAEQKLRNQLLEQAVAMKKQFTSEVKNRVETERDGRLSRLSELAGSVSDLEKLTSEWNSVIDANLKTQHLQVAVEAVRAGLEQADRPRPFVKELAALKEIAADDPIVNSAIASINPVAYQLGVPTSGQLIDRFRHVAKEVRKASLLPEDAGVASHAASLLLSKLLFKKQGRAVGDDVESVLTRAETLLEEGDLDEAAREMNTLTGWAKTLSKDWLAEVRRVLEVRQALDLISTEARLQSLKVD